MSTHIEKHYRCAVCGNSLNHTSSLQDHTESTLGSNPTIVKCVGKASCGTCILCSLDEPQGREAIQMRHVRKELHWVHIFKPINKSSVERNPTNILCGGKASYGAPVFLFIRGSTQERNPIYVVCLIRAWIKPHIFKPYKYERCGKSFIPISPPSDPSENSYRRQDIQMWTRALITVHVFRNINESTLERNPTNVLRVGRT